MSDILTQIGLKVKSLFKRGGPSSAFDKSQILSQIDTNILGLTNFISTHSNIKNKGVFESLGKTTIPSNAATKESSVAAKAYTDFLANSTTPVRILEQKLFLKSFAVAYESFLQDHQLFKSKFNELFGDTSELNLESVKMTHAILIGYLSNVDKVMRWVDYLFDNLSIAQGSLSYAYRLTYLTENSKLISKMIDSVISRPATYSIFSEIERVKNGGTDVFLTIDGKTADAYASDRDYSENARLMMSGFIPIPNPGLLIGRYVIIQERRRYERRRAMKEWLAAKVAFLNMQLDGLDPESPEYKKQVKVIESYAQQIAEYDRLIAEYEAGA